jgi:hypothetical protein
MAKRLFSPIKSMLFLPDDIGNPARLDAVDARAEGQGRRRIQQQRAITVTTRSMSAIRILQQLRRYHQQGRRESVHIKLDPK